MDFGRTSALRSLRSVVALVLVISVTASCVWVSKRVDIGAVDPRVPVAVKSPVKAHLKDGATVMFPSGVTVTATTVAGAGSHYDLNLTGPTAVSSIPIDDIAGMETYRIETDMGSTLSISVLSTVGAVVGSVVLAAALFGSCPTVYSADGQIEEAELFSTSIAPLFEGRDLDLLKTRPDTTGRLSLEIRNEAMETHYLNHLQLLEVLHTPDEVIVPDAAGSPIALRGVHPARTVMTRGGRDISALLSAADDTFYVVDRDAIDRTSAADMEDWIDVTAEVPPGTTSAALTFRMRNSLLNTVLLYDVMLGPAGARALDWMGQDLANISTAVELGGWHQRHSGLHVSVWRDGRYQEVVRVPDAGPITWHDIAAVVAVPEGETLLRVRLSFLTDHWRIDRLGVSASVRSPAPRIVPLSGVRNAAGQAEAGAFLDMGAPDGRYLTTTPGQRFVADFHAGPPPVNQARTFLLSSQGYYTEWIRGDWIRSARPVEPFVAGDDALLTALRRWGQSRDEFETLFFGSRVPVR